MTKKRLEPISYGYQRISLVKARQLTDAWLDKTLPESQWQVVAPILKQRKIPVVARPVIKIVKRLGLKRLKLLDVGCSSGYYYDFFRWAGVKIRYAGCDISPSFISLAKRNHRWTDFKIAPIIDLPYKDGSFDVILASGVLHHELDYRRAMEEMIRVTSRYILLHRLPVFSANTRISCYKKTGYGVEMLEIVFALRILSQMFSDLGLTMLQYWPGNKLDIKSSACWTTILLEKSHLDQSQREQISRFLVPRESSLKV